MRRASVKGYFNDGVAFSGKNSKRENQATGCEFNINVQINDPHSRFLQCPLARILKRRVNQTSDFPLTKPNASSKQTGRRCFICHNNRQSEVLIPVGTSCRVDKKNTCQ